MGRGEDETCEKDWFCLRTRGGKRRGWREVDGEGGGGEGREKEEIEKVVEAEGWR